MGVQLKGLKRERHRRGVSLAELAKEAGVTYSYLSELESGKRQAGIDVVRRLSGALKTIPVIDGAEQLLAGDDQVAS